MPPRKKKPTGPTPVDAIIHPDKRTNLPTAGAHDLVSPSVEAVKILRYPRDSSLDPQLVWRGKDDEDPLHLDVPAPPIFIQEKIDPRVLIENLRDTAGGGDAEPELSLFETFDGLGELEVVEFYEHEANWSNRLILGDSLRVMSSLNEREGLRGRVQCVYFDPPYGIRFSSNFQWSTASTDVTDGRAEHLTREAEQVRAFRDTWSDGVHSYLTYLRDRFVVARDLLTDSGSMFVQIGEDNVHRVRSLMDEVFGADNFVSTVTYKTSVGLGAELLDSTCNYIVWYARNRPAMKFRPLFQRLTAGREGATRYKKLRLPDLTERAITPAELEDPSLRPAGARLFRDQGLTSRSASATTTFPIAVGARTYRPSTGGWRTSETGMRRVIRADRVLQTGQTLSFRKYFDDFGALALDNFWSDVSGGVTSRSDPKVYVVQTATSVVERCVLMASDPGDLILDPTCGGGTTPRVAEQWGRRWIGIDTSRVALALSRARLMGARYPFYVVSGSKPDGTDMTAAPKERARAVAKGFAYERLPRITLRDIANNAQIDEIWDRWEPETSERLAAVCALVGESWDEFSIPRDPEAKWSKHLIDAHASYWESRIQRQAEIDRSISACAEAQDLYDRPLEDATCVRVTGPFTVETLAPHFAGPPSVVVSPAVDTTAAQHESIFRQQILENLAAAGIQNGIRKERIKLATLEPFAGAYLHGVGLMSDAEDEAPHHDVGISIGPQYGTVSAAFIKSAAREAAGAGVTGLLAVLGFSFDPLVLGASAGESDVQDDFDVASERSLAGLRILLVRMNTDLLGGGALRKTASANLFMLFGRPDIEIVQEANAVVVKIRGVDVYDPIADQVRSDGTDRIALWMVDTNYDGESFFVRHCYFTGTKDPFAQLKAALRSDIDATAWAALYRTESLPFQPPRTGQIAVKVINNYGDEVVQVFDVGPTA